jgi:hypothetical protein
VPDPGALEPAEPSRSLPAKTHSANRYPGRGRTISAARALLLRARREATFDAIHMPFSRSYVAVTANGQGVAWAGKTYVDYVDRDTVLLPGYHASTGTGNTPASSRGSGAICAQSISSSGH